MKLAWGSATAALMIASVPGIGRADEPAASRGSDTKASAEASGSVEATAEPNRTPSAVDPGSKSSAATEDAFTSAATPVEGNGEPEYSARESLPDDEPVVVLRQPFGDDEVVLSVRGAMQLRAGVPFDGSTGSLVNGAIVPETGVMLRRVRFGVDATVLPTLSFSVVSDLVDGLTPPEFKSPIFLAYANADLRLTQVRVGYMRVPFSRHAQVDETRLVFVEPASAWRSDRQGVARVGTPSVLPDRRAGATFHEEIDGYSFAFGAFSDSALSSAAPSGDALFAGRIEIGPFGAVPLEGAFFVPDYEYRNPRVSLSIGGLARSGTNGASSRAGSAAISACYKGFYVSVEGVLGDTRAGSESERLAQKAAVADVAYRFPIVGHGLELGARGDVFAIETGAGSERTVSSLAGVANVYVWRHRTKVSTIGRVVRDGRTDVASNERYEGLAELTLGF